MCEGCRTPAPCRSQDHTAAWSGTPPQLSIVIVIVIGALAGGECRSGGYQAARSERDGDLLGGIVGIRPANGEAGCGLVGSCCLRLYVNMWTVELPTQITCRSHQLNHLTIIKIYPMNVPSLVLNIHASAAHHAGKDDECPDGTFCLAVQMQREELHFHEVPPPWEGPGKAVGRPHWGPCL